MFNFTYLYYVSLFIKSKLVIPVALTVRMHHAAGYFRFDLPFQSQYIQPGLDTVHNAALIAVDYTQRLDPVIGEAGEPFGVYDILSGVDKLIFHKVPGHDVHRCLE